MHRIGTFLGLPAADRWLALRAACWLVLARLALSTLPFARVQELAALASRRMPIAGLAPGRVAWAVETTARSIPGASCLTQALAADVLLRRQGETPALRIGVATDSEDFEAHAWLELHGRPLVGDIGLDRYETLEARDPGS